MANFHKHWYGTLALYNAIATKDSNTLYYCSEGLIYKGSVLLATRRWGDLSGVPSTFTPSAHTHDDRYYTETEVNTLLADKDNWDTAYGWGNHASAGYALNSALTTHTGLTNNPHSVTKAQIGLGSVNDTADSAKNVLSATKLTTKRTIWGRDFDGTGNVSGAITGATSGAFSTKVTTGGYNYSAQTAGVGIGADGAFNGIIFYDNSGASGRIYRDGDVLYFTRGTSSTSGFYMSNIGAVTFNQAIETKGLLTATGNIATANINGAYIKVGSATISWDSVNGALRIDKPVYSTSSLSAFGLGSGGASGGSSYERLDDWDDYTGTKSGWVLSALLGNDLDIRVTNLETSTPNVSWGTPASYYVPLNINGSTKNLSLNGHIHSQYLTGITASQVTTALGFTPYNSTNPSGYTTNKGTVTSVGLSVPTGLSVSDSPVTVSGTLAIKLASGYSIPTTAKQGQWDTAYNNNHTHSNKSVLDGITSVLVTNWGSAYTFTSGFATSYPDLTAIEGLTGTAGFLKKTGANTWSLDTSTYLTGITKAQVEGVLTGAITTHTHDGRYYTESEIGNILSGTTVVSGYSKSNWDTAYSHTSLTNNPHGVTKSQVGLGSVNNTADSAKNVLSATKLTTKRTIWGQDFDGTSNVSGAITGATSVSATSLYASSSVRVWGHETKPISFGDALDGILILCPLGMGSANNVAGTIYITRSSGEYATTRLDFGYSVGSTSANYNAYLEYTKGSRNGSDVWELVSFSYSGQQWVGLRRTGSIMYFYTSAYFSGENLYDGHNSLTWISSSSATSISALSYSTSRKVFTQAVTMDSSLTVLGSASFQSVSATSFSGPLTGNASSATILATARNINGVSFNGSANITIKANTPYTLTRGSYLTGSNFNGSANTTWAVDATSANTASKVVARDSNGDFSCHDINASSGVYSLKVVTGGHNYAAQTHGVGIGTDGSNSGVIFYNGTGATARIYRESNVMRFVRGGLSYSGFDINADGSITVQGDMTTRTSLVVGSVNGTYVQIGSARLVYDQANNAIKVVNANNSSCSLYATGSISAFGIGSSGGSGTSYSRLDDWGDYVDGLTNDYVLSAELGHGLHTSVNSLNSFRSGTAWGGTGTGYNYLSIGGTSKVVSIHGHSHSFTSLTNKPTTLAGYGITNALPSTGGTLHGSNFQILELKRNGSVGASMLFSNNQQVLAKFGFDASGSLVMGTGTSTDGVPNMLYINAGTKQITGYGNLVVSGNIETGTSDGAYVRIGNSRFLFDNAITGIHLFKMAGGYAALRAGSVYANNVELTSSRSMKKDIQPFKNGLDLIKSIDVVSYLYKEDADDDDRKIGFIADDTDSWLSGKSKTKYNIGNTVGALIKAVQELEKKNHELEMRLLSVTNNKLRI